MNINKKNAIHCAIVRLQNRNEEITKISITKEVKAMIAEHEFGVSVILEELDGMEPSEIQAERKMFKKYFAMMGIK